MFACLEKAVDHAVKFDTPQDGMFTAFMVNRVKMSAIDAVKNHTENQSGLLLKQLKKEKFDPWRQDERLQRLIRTLEPVAVLG